MKTIGKYIAKNISQKNFENSKQLQKFLKYCRAD